MDEARFPEDAILLVDDEPATLSAFELSLALAGITNVIACNDSSRVMELLEEVSSSVVALDLMMPALGGAELLPMILERHPDTAVVIITSRSDVELVVSLIRDGAFDYLVKPVEANRLVTTIRRAMESHDVRLENTALKRRVLSTELERPEAFDHMIARDPSVLALFGYIEAIASTSLPVLITGETGVGKELFATAVHRSSGRSGELVTVNSAGLDDQLFSDTLFGHEKGAFTGAVSARQGMIARAAGGTLFLDEIGDLSPESQIKLLRLTQQREYYRLGSDSPMRTNARLVCATNRDIDSLVSEGSFRQDLWYRLRSHMVEVPPLRTRPGDIEPLVEHFLEGAARETGRPKPRMPRGLIPYLRGYDFPGNVRELEGLILDAVVREKSDTLSMGFFERMLNATIVDRDAAAERQRVDDLADPSGLFSRLDALPALRATTEELINEALRRADGNQTIAARLIGMSRSALNKRLQK